VAFGCIDYNGTIQRHESRLSTRCKTQSSVLAVYIFPSCAIRCVAFPYFCSVCPKAAALFFAQPANGNATAVPHLGQSNTMLPLSWLPGAYLGR